MGKILLIATFFSFLSVVALVFLIKEVNSRPDSLTVTVEAGGPYVKDMATPKVLVVGEVKFEGEPANFANVTIRIYENTTLKVRRDLTASSEGKYFAIFHDLEPGTYFVNVSANYSSANAWGEDTFKIASKFYGCVEKNVSFYGLAQDHMKGQTISSGNVKIFIKENGDKFGTEFSQGNWFVTFTSCLIPDQRHTAIIQIKDSGRVSWNEIQFRG